MRKKITEFLFGDKYENEDWRLVFAPRCGCKPNPHCGYVPHCGEPGPDDPDDRDYTTFEYILWLLAFIFIGIPFLTSRGLKRWFFGPKHIKKNKDKIRVAFISVYNAQCGISTYNEDLMSELRKYANVRVFAEYGTPREGDDPSWVVRCWGRKEHPKKHLIAALRAWEPDIIHFSHEYGFFPKAYQFTGLITQIKAHLDVPIVSTMHSVYEHLDKIVQESATDHLIVHTPGAKACLINKGFSEDNITVVPHGSNILAGNFDQPELLSTLWNTWGSEHTIYQPGFLFTYKGHMRMLNIVAKLKQKYPDVQYIIQGSENPNTIDEHNSLYDKIIKCSKELGLEDNVSIHRGFLPKDVLLSHIRTVKCCVLPYSNHPAHDVRATSGIARMVMATKTPLVVSNVHLFDDLEGVIPRAADDDELYNEIDKIFSDPKMINKQVEAKKAFLRKTNWGEIALRITSVYSNLLNK